ncbi:MAG: CAP domain-containing protein [Patescibacteria group bacterium]
MNRYFLRHLFLPHASNNHRAKVLHIDALLIYVLIFTVINFGMRLLHRSYPEVLGYAANIHLEELLSATNAKRTAAGLPPLTLNSQLSAAAARKAADMFSKNYWAHNSPAGQTPWDFIVAAGYKYALAGENLAKNFSDSRGVVEAWMNSSTHRDNILKSGYRDIGFAIVNGVLNGEETTLVVQMFGTPATPVAALPPTLPTLTAPARQIEVLPAPPRTIVASAFTGVAQKPLFNIPSVSRDIVFVFVGILMGVMVVDAWVVTRRRIVRVVGHNIAHTIFLSALLIATTSVTRGSLL